MRAGLLTDLIKILVPVVRKNSVGEQVKEYEVYNCIKARPIYGLGAREMQNADEIVYGKTMQFEFRSYQKIDDFDRIDWQDKRYIITDITTDRRNQKKIITCEKLNE